MPRRARTELIADSDDEEVVIWQSVDLEVKVNDLALTPDMDKRASKQVFKAIKAMEKKGTPNPKEGRVLVVTENEKRTIIMHGGDENSVFAFVPAKKPAMWGYKKERQWKGE